MTRLKELRSTLSDDELLEKVHEWVSKLCKSGARDWVLHIPVDINRDPDILISELCERFKELKEKTRTKESEMTNK